MHRKVLYKCREARDISILALYKKCLHTIHTERVYPTVEIIVLMTDLNFLHSRDE